MSPGGSAARAIAAVPALAFAAPALRPLFGIGARLDAEGVFLTFDDGPHPEGTPAVLEALAEVGARATFFLVGEQVERRPDLAAAVASAGHEVALHCHRHRLLLRLAAAEVRADLERAAEVVAAAAGVSPRLYRAPFGVFTRPALEVAREHGWQPLHWTRNGRDWRADATAASIAARVTARLRRGDVVLLHDSNAYGAGSWRATADATRAILDRAAGRGLAPALHP